MRAREEEKDFEMVQIDGETAAFMLKHGINEREIFHAGDKQRLVWQAEMEHAGLR
jgi:hypothetical protein